MEEQDLYRLSVHGPEGRIAHVRRLLKLKQSEFAQAIGTSRETVSHWENLDSDGLPKQRTTRRNAAAIAELVQERLGYNLTSEAFFGPGETAWDTLNRRQNEISARQNEISARQNEMADQLASVLEMLGDIKQMLGPRE